MCGFPSQHQPSFGAPPLIHIAGTRRSWRRDPESMKHLFFSSRCGAWVTTAMPSSMVSGVRPRPRMTGSASSGRTLRNSSPRWTPRQQVGPGVGHGQLRQRAIGREVTVGVVAVDEPGLRAVRQPEQGHRVVRAHELAGHHEDERDVVLLRDPRRRAGQRLEQVPELRLLQAGERRVAECDQAVDLVPERLGSVVRHGHLLEWRHVSNAAAGAGSSRRLSSVTA